MLVSSSKPPTEEGTRPVLDPHSLVQLDADVPQLDGVVLVHALSGFVDAGAGVRLAREHLLDTLEHRVVARFDIDQVLDYRARRPLMTFVEDHWESYEEPTLAWQFGYLAIGRDPAEIRRSTWTTRPRGRQPCRRRGPA